MARRDKKNQEQQVDYSLTFSKNERLVKEYPIFSKNGKCQTSIILSNKRVVLDCIDRVGKKVHLNRQEMRLNDVAKVDIVYKEVDNSLGDSIESVKKGQKGFGIFMIAFGIIVALLGAVLFLKDTIMPLAESVAIIATIYNALSVIVPYGLYVIIGGAVMLILGIILVATSKKKIQTSFDQAFTLQIYSKVPYYPGILCKNYSTAPEDEIANLPTISIDISPAAADLIKNIGSDILDAQENTYSMPITKDDTVMPAPNPEKARIAAAKIAAKKKIIEKPIEEIKDEDLDKISTNDLVNMTSNDE